MSQQDLPALLLEACRGLAACGLGAGVGGHVSVRVPGQDLYYCHTFDRTFEELQLSDIVLIDFDGKVIGSNRAPSIGIDFHHGIYRQRLDVGAIVHSHGFWMTAQAAFARPPRIFNNVSATFYGRTTVSPNDSFDAIGPALGADDIAVVIPWHGAITLGETLGEAVARHVVFDYTARMDVQLPAHTPMMPHEQCATLRALVERSGYYEQTWELVRRKGKAAWDGERIRPLPAP